MPHALPSPFRRLLSAAASRPFRTLVVLVAIAGLLLAARVAMADTTVSLNADQFRGEQTVTATGSAPGKWAKLVIKRPGGTVLSPGGMSTCFNQTSNHTLSYGVKKTDTNGTWSVEMREYNNSNQCGNDTSGTAGTTGSSANPGAGIRTFKIDNTAPTASDDSSDAWRNAPLGVKLTASDTGGSTGAVKIYFTKGSGAFDGPAAIAGNEYTPNATIMLNHGESIKYFAVDPVGNQSTPVQETKIARVETAAPTTSSDFADSGTWRADDVTVTLTPDDTGGSGVDKTYFTVGQAPADPGPAVPGAQVYSSSNKPVLAHNQVVKYRTIDVAGNAETVKQSGVAQVDKSAPTTLDSVDDSWHDEDVVVELDAYDGYKSGVKATYFTVGTGDFDPPTASEANEYDPADKPVLKDGEKIKYFSVDNVGNAEPLQTSANAAKVDKGGPSTSDNVDDALHDEDDTETLTRSDSQSGVKATYFTVGTGDFDPPTAAEANEYDPADKPVLKDGESIKYFSVDNVDNAEAVKSSQYAAKVDKADPSTSDDVPTSWQNEDVTVTLKPTDTGGSQIDKTYFTVGTGDFDPPTAVETDEYDPNDKPVLENGESIKYFSVDVAGNTEPVQESPAAKVDKATPSTSDDVDDQWHPADVTVTLTRSDSQSDIKATYFTVGTGDFDPPTASEADEYDPADKPVL